MFELRAMCEASGSFKQLYDQPYILFIFGNFNETSTDNIEIISTTKRADIIIAQFGS